MSFINPTTLRHEDDISALVRADGEAPLSEILAHLNECVVANFAAYPANVRAPVKMLTMYVEQLIAQAVVAPDVQVRI